MDKLKHEYFNLINSLLFKSKKEKINGVNDFFNDNFAYVKDANLYDEMEVWSTPQKFLERGAGDCEDFAIAKFFALKKLGIKVNYLCYCSIVYTKEKHLMNLVEINDELFALDILTSGVIALEDRKDVVPILCFDEKDVFTVVNSKIDKRVGDYTRIKKWKEVLDAISF